VSSVIFLKHFISAISIFLFPILSVGVHISELYANIGIAKVLRIVIYVSFLIIIFNNRLTVPYAYGPMITFTTSFLNLYSQGLLLTPGLFKTCLHDNLEDTFFGEFFLDFFARFFIVRYSEIRFASRNYEGRQSGCSVYTHSVYLYQVTNKHPTVHLNKLLPFSDLQPNPTATRTRTLPRQT
jgi:hypothetical protein